jgi:hypothetical protein
MCRYLSNGPKVGCANAARRGREITHSQEAAAEEGGGMMYIYPGELRVFELSGRSEVFVPGSAVQASRFHTAFSCALPLCFRRMIDVVDEAFPRVAVACRRAELYESDAVFETIRRRTGIFDLKLDFDDPATLARFLQEYAASEIVRRCVRRRAFRRTGRRFTSHISEGRKLSRLPAAPSRR